MSWQRCVHYLTNHYQWIKHKSSLWGACAHGQTPKAGAVRKSILVFTPSSSPNVNLHFFISVLGLILSLAVGLRNIIPFSCASTRGWSVGSCCRGWVCMRMSHHSGLCLLQLPGQPGPSFWLCVLMWCFGDIQHHCHSKPASWLWFRALLLLWPKCAESCSKTGASICTSICWEKVMMDKLKKVQNCCPGVQRWVVSEGMAAPAPVWAVPRSGVLMSGLMSGLTSSCWLPEGTQNLTLVFVSCILCACVYPEKLVGKKITRAQRIHASKDAQGKRLK